MGLKIYRERDADLNVLRGRMIGIIGYGNQGRAHALNLRDAGLGVVVGQRPGAGVARAEADGFRPVSVREATEAADLVVLTLPDETAAAIYAESVAPALTTRKTLGFVHGFNIRFGLIDPPAGIDVVLVAPKGPGTLLRSLYVAGRGLPALAAVERNPSGRAWATALAWAAGIGSTRAGVVETTFADETETDLFGEQAVLCGGVTALMKAAFATLVEAGYAPEFAYLECVHELKQIVDLVYTSGLSGMRARISNTAEYGDLTRGPRMINAETRREMVRVLEEVRSGAFAREWLAECAAGKPRFQQLYTADAESEFEKAGQAVRQLMPWLAEGD
jgi:ketol-acid reductoisomerase